MCVTNKSGRIGQRTNNLSDELIRDELRHVTKGWCIIAPIERYSGYRYFQRKKKVLQSSMFRFCLF